MPRNVRNFWLEIYVDGRKTKVETGPRGKGGGFVLDIFQRSEGGVEKAGRIYGVEENGYLELSLVTGVEDRLIYRSRR